MSLFSVGFGSDAEPDPGPGAASEADVGFAVPAEFESGAFLAVDTNVGPLAGIGSGTDAGAFKASISFCWADMVSCCDALVASSVLIVLRDRNRCGKLIR